MLNNPEEKVIPKKSEFHKIRNEISKNKKKTKEEKKIKKIEQSKEWEKLKKEIILLKKEVKIIKKEYKLEKKKTKHNLKSDKKEQEKQLSILKDKSYYNIWKIYDEINNKKFQLHKKHNTLIWNFKKWMFGIGKEFRRICWSPPLVTIKYLGIVLLIIGLLTLVFTLITYLVNLI